MNGRHRKRGVDQAVEIDNLADIGLPDTDVVHLADQIDFCRDLIERVAHSRDAGGRRFAARLIMRLQGLDVGLDLNSRSQFLAHRLFESARNVVRRAEGEGAIDLEIE